MENKKIMNEEHLEAIIKDDEVLSTLKERWFKLAAIEDYPNNKKTTKKLDDLEKAINDRKEELTK
jgi:hypothetical protein